MKKVIIMGATSGIGRAVAEALASRGLKIGAAGRNEKALEELREAYPGLVVTERIDINHANAPERLKALIDRLGGMDIYFHSSGIGYENQEMDPNLEAKIVETDTTGFARMVMAAFRYYAEENKEGTIAALTSVAGTLPIGMMAAYSASKKFDSTYLSALRQLALIKGQDIHITDIRPGWTRTPLLTDDRHYPMEMTTEEVVPQVIRALVRHPRTAIIDCRWRALMSLASLLPTCLWERIPYRP